MRRERVAETFAQRRDGKWEFGSGYLIEPRLVLTAAHTVITDGAPAPSVVVRFLGGPSKLTGRVAWWRHDDTVDAALVEITDAGRLADAAPVRWGRLTGARGGVECEAIGFPHAQRDGIEGVRDSEHLTGTINSGTQAKGRRHDVLLDGWPEPGARTSAWAGVSGAALFCGELLTGVLVADPEEFASRRLRAVPVGEFLHDPGFAELVGDRIAESVELASLFEPQTAEDRPRSPAYLLRADAEVVPFHARTRLLADLTAWCQEPDAVSAWLVTGPGGQGKTRLARELAARRRADGWAVGWLRSDEGDPPDLDRLAASAVPVLVIIDYAETRTDQVLRLVTRLGAARDPGLRIRLLLLARHPGDWWRQLITGSAAAERLLARQAIELPSLADTADARRALFDTAARHFALALRERRPPAVPLPPDPGKPPVLPEPPPDLGHPRYASVLTLHMTALVALLQTGPEPVPSRDGEGVEQVLLRHEERYWNSTAVARGLRFAYSKALARAVAAATLFAAATETEAARLLGRIPGLRDQPEDRLLALAEWLHDLYPAADRRYWGALQPDRLGEHLVARVTADAPELFDRLFAEVSGEQARNAFQVLSRSAAVQPQAADVIARAVSARPALAAFSAAAATYSDNPDPLVKAIEPLIDHVADEPDWLHDLMGVTWAAPSLFGEWSIRALRRLVERRRELARTGPETHRRGLAEKLFALAERLNTVGLRDEALELLEEALPLLRELPADADSALPSALGLLAGIYSELGRAEEALRAGEESAECFERRDPPDLRGTVQALSNLSALRKDAGDLEGSLRAAERALEVYHQVSEPDPWLTLTATSAGTNKANRLSELGHPEVGLDMLREVVHTRRLLARHHPVFFDDDLASALHNLAKTLHWRGDNEEARRHIEEAIALYTPLAERVPAVYRRKLAETLIIRGEILVSLPGELRTAVESMAQALMIAATVNDTMTALFAIHAIDHTRRRFPVAERYMAETIRDWARPTPSAAGDEPRPGSPNTVRITRQQPKRRSRRDRKGK